MLVRMVSISGPRDLPTLASQSAGITGLSYCSQSLIYLFMLERGSHSAASAIVQGAIIAHGNIELMGLSLAEDYRQVPQCLANFHFI